ncbi:hypothetical protein ScPMuIL_012116 [Solemya velum]
MFGGVLVVPNTPRKQQYLEEQLRKVGGVNNYWIGGTDIVLEGDWLWAPDMQRVTFAPWGDENRTTNPELNIAHSSSSTQTTLGTTRTVPNAKSMCVRGRWGTSGWHEGAPDGN